jgi:hypothetical protein
MGRNFGRNEFVRSRTSEGDFGRWWVRSSHLALDDREEVVRSVGCCGSVNP